MEQSSHPYSYKRIEHLKLRKSIEMVFAQNNVLRSGPIKLIFAVEPSDSFSYQVGFVAPKKVHHFAVDRNRNKRLLREAFRLNRHVLTSRMDNKTVKVSFCLWHKTVGRCRLPMLKQLSDSYLPVCRKKWAPKVQICEYVLHLLNTKEVFC